MLVLSRKEDEQICIGDDVVITIVRVSGDRVRIGIEAPSSRTILRKELKNNDSARSADASSERKAAEAGKTESRSFELTAPSMGVACCS